MAALSGPGQVAIGFQLPMQSLSPTFVQPWELDATVADFGSVVDAADAAGFTYVGVCDHVAIPEGAPIGTTWYDAVATMGWILARTSQVHVLSHVYVTPYRHPLQVAKSFATLDHLSEGRVLLGVGAGHVEGEFAALGVDFAGRGAALDESLDAVRRLFTEEFVSLDGPRWVTGPVAVAPRPHREGGPPIWVGGSSERAIRRAARFDGWLPQGPPKIGTRAAMELIASVRDGLGLGGEPFDLGVNCEPCYVGPARGDLPPGTAAGSGAEVAERLGRYLARGMTQLQVRFPTGSAQELVDQLGRFGAEVIPELQQRASAAPTHL